MTRRAAAAWSANSEVSHIRPIFRQYYGDPDRVPGLHHLRTAVTD